MLQLNLFCLKSANLTQVGFEDHMINHNLTQVRFEELYESLYLIKTDQTSEQIIKNKYLNNKFIQEIINLIQTKIQRLRKITLSEYII